METQQQQQRKEENSVQDLSQILGVLLSGFLSAAAAAATIPFNGDADLQRSRMIVDGGHQTFYSHFCPHNFYGHQTAPQYPLLNSNWIAISALLCGCPLCNRFLVNHSWTAFGGGQQNLITSFPITAADAPVSHNSCSSSVVFDKNKLSYGLSHLLNAQQIGHITLRTLMLLEIARQKQKKEVKETHQTQQSLQTQPASERLSRLPETEKTVTTTIENQGNKGSPSKKRQRLTRRELAAFSATHIDTGEIVARVKNLLVEHAIGQRLFGAAVLGLSQGSVSQLLADPKPWSALNFGREPYIRMVRWLETLPRSMNVLKEMKAGKLLAKMKKQDELMPEWIASPAQASAFFWSHFGQGNEDDENNNDEVSEEGVQPLKRRRRRHHFSREQLTVLRDHFRVEPHPRPLEMQKIAERLGLKYRHIDAWFHNNRVRGSKVKNFFPQSDSVSTFVAKESSTPETSVAGASSGRTSVEFESFFSTSPSSSSNSYSNFSSSYFKI